jgi:hypothetical protein
MSPGINRKDELKGRCEVEATPEEEIELLRNEVNEGSE